MTSTTKTKKKIQANTNKWDEEQIKKMVADEVAIQMTPIKEMLKKVYEWQLGFWSNGSGRPEGLFQSRMREDDERNQRLSDELKVQTLLANRLDDYVKAEITKQEYRKQQREKWLSITKWIGGGGGIGAVLITFSVWLWNHVSPLVHLLWNLLK